MEKITETPVGRPGPAAPPAGDAFPGLDKYRGLPERARRTPARAHGYNSYTARSLELKHLHECVRATEETVATLYGPFTPRVVRYQRGTRPLLEMITDRVCAGLADPAEKAVALVRWQRANLAVLARAGLGTEEEILLGGVGLCHDFSRVLVTLCQVAGLGARIVIGLGSAPGGGHTFAEVYAGNWALLDASPRPWAFYRRPDGSLAGAWDLRRDPTLPAACPSEFPPAPGSRGDHTACVENFHLVNYPLEESTRYMALRFLRTAAALKSLDNYDYVGHLANEPVARFLDLDETVARWVDSTMEKR